MPELPETKELMLKSQSDAKDYVDHPETKDPKVNKEMPAKKDQVVQLDLKGLLDHPDFKDRQDWMGTKDLKDQLVNRAKMLNIGKKNLFLLNLNFQYFSPCPKRNGEAVAGDKGKNAGGYGESSAKSPSSGPYRGRRI